MKFLRNLFGKKQPTANASNSERPILKESASPPKLLNLDERISQGNTLKSKGKYNEAVKCFKQLLTDEPRNVEAWFYLADVYTCARDYGTALACLEQVVALNPSYPQAKEKVQDMKPVVNSNPAYRSNYMTEKNMFSAISQFNFD